jgi:hypothetical protein
MDSNRATSSGAANAGGSSGPSTSQLVTQFSKDMFQPQQGKVDTCNPSYREVGI